MKFSVGAKIVVKNVYSGGNFDDGDIVTVAQIGNEDEPDCYGAISPHDGEMWYLYEDEVGPATNADHIRSMRDEELAKWICSIMTAECCDQRCPARDICSLGDNGLVKWMKQPVKEE